MTVIRAANLFFFQFFFIRLAKEVVDNHVIARLFLIGVIPFTGWWSDYIGPRWRLYFWKE